MKILQIITWERVQITQIVCTRIEKNVLPNRGAQMITRPDILQTTTADTGTDHTDPVDQPRGNFHTCRGSVDMKLVRVIC